MQFLFGLWVGAVSSCNQRKASGRALPDRPAPRYSFPSPLAGPLGFSEATIMDKHFSAFQYRTIKRGVLKFGIAWLQFHRQTRQKSSHFPQCWLQAHESSLTSGLNFASSSCQSFWAGRVEVPNATSNAKRRRTEASKIRLPYFEQFSFDCILLHLYFEIEMQKLARASPTCLQFQKYRRCEAACIILKTSGAVFLRQEIR